MTDADHAFWLAYLRSLADQLGLKDWRVILWRDPCEDGATAVVSCTDGSRSLVVNLGRQWLTLPPDEQRRVSIHELLHPHFQEIAERVNDAARKFGDNSLMQYLPDLIAHEIEHAVDAISYAIGPLYPLPGETA